MSIEKRGHHEQFKREFERQLDNLLRKGYPEAAGVSVSEFLKNISPLQEKVNDFNLPAIDLEKGELPLVIVVKSDWVAAEKAMALVERNGNTGFTKLYPHEPKDFTTIDGVSIPGSKAYLLLDIDRGKDSINIAPKEALGLITKWKRSPLTIDEGVAIVIQYPEFLAKNNGFSLLASRHSGDKRVPAIWINHEKQPNLGWCWDGNPHTWLGSASCRARA